MELGITNFIFSLIKSLNHNVISDTFIIILHIVFIWGLLHKSVREIVPIILTMMGILGTFLGITLGLSQFDVENIDTSIPHLLNGLKVAFIVSATGVFLAIIFKKINIFLAQSKTEKIGIADEITPKAIYSVLTEINQNIQQNIKALQQTIISENEQQRQLLTELKRTISSEADSSLTHQLIRLRLEVTDSAKSSQEVMQRGFHTMQQRFQEFADKVVELSSKSLIEALQEAIKDFNSKLSEQFGENFKHLNDAVGKLLSWQENYRVQMENMQHNLQKIQERFEAALQGIEKSDSCTQSIAQNVTVISQQLDLIPQLMAQLGILIRGLDVQSQELTIHLSSFKELGDKASSALPMIQQTMCDLTSGAKMTVEQNLNLVKQEFETLKMGFLDLKGQANNVVQETAISLKQNFDALKNQTEVIVSENSNEIRGLLTSQQQTFDNLQQHFTAHVTTVDESLKITVRDLNQQFETLKMGFSDLKGQANNVVQETAISLKQNFDALKNQTEVIISENTNEIRALFISQQQSFNHLQQHFTAHVTTVDESLKITVQGLNRQTEHTTIAIEHAEKVFIKFSELFESQSKISDTLEQHLKKMGEVTEEFDNTLSSHKSTFRELKQGFDELKGQLDERVAKLRIEFDHANKNLQQVIDNQFKSLDEQMTQEMQRTIEQFGRNLISLSSGFVDNYEKLTRQLSKAVIDLKKEVRDRES